MMRKSIIITTLLLIAVIQVIAQSKVLRIGDKVPDLILQEFLLGNEKSAKLSDFKGRLVIFDFYTRSCTPCIAAMPKMDSLQNLFGNNIKIIPVVTADKNKYSLSKELNLNFWKTNNYTKKTRLNPLLDTTLQNYFPYQAVPYEVWINGDGILVGLTTFVNEKEISRVLSGNMVDKNSNTNREPLTYNFNQSLLNIDKSQGSYPLTAYYTAITGFIPGDIARNVKSNRYTYDIQENKTRLYFINQQIETLYRNVLNFEKNSLGHAVNRNRWIWNVRDSSKYIFPFNATEQQKIQWKTMSVYCYESLLPGLRTESEMFSNMKIELDNFFHLETKIEKRLMDCWVLKRTSLEDKLLFSNRNDNTADSRQGKKGTTEFFYYKTDIKEMTVLKQSIEALVRDISDQSDLPVIDETNINTRVKLAIDLIMKDGKPQEHLTFAPGKISNQLKQYGLDILKVKREMDVFVITEKDYENEKFSK